MPDLARFFNIDPLNEVYAYQSHYNFSENRATDGVELEGLEFQSIKQAQDYVASHDGATLEFVNEQPVVTGYGETIQEVSVQGGNYLSGPDLSNAPTMGPMPETMRSKIADFRNAEAPAITGIGGTLVKGLIDSGLDATNYLRNINPFSDQRDYNGLYPRFTD